MALLTSTPWNIILFAAFCIAASLLMYRVRDGLFLWLAAGLLITPVASHFAKMPLLWAYGAFVAGSGSSLLLLIWLDERARKVEAKKQ